MGVIIPQVLTEDRASGAQVIDGSLRFDSSKGQYLTWTPSTSGNRGVWTISFWAKLNKITGYQYFFSAGTNLSSNFMLFQQDSGASTVAIYDYTSSFQWYIDPVDVFRDPSAWYHFLINLNTPSQSVNFYVNNRLVGQVNTLPSSNYQGFWNHNVKHRISDDTYSLGCHLSQFYNIDGQALGPEYFGYTDPLTNTWRPKKYTGTYGTNGFYLPLDGNTPIGQDQSGRGNNWTPVNFGGSNTLEKATGALPILNTDGGGKVARVGVRTDSNANNLLLALPMLGSSVDVSNKINSGSSTKTTTDSGVTYPSTQSNFYGNSVFFDSTDTITLSGTWFGDSSFTVEFWGYITDYGDLWTVGGNSCSFYVSSTQISTDGNGVGRVNFTNANSGIKIPLNKWTHFAYVKDGSSYYMFIDGIRFNSASTGSGQNSGTWVLGGTRSDVSDSADWYLQDLRYYQGAKYTQNFIPASTDPDILPDTPSGVAYSSNVTAITDGAVAFDGSGDYLQTAASGTDFTVGGGAFSIECWAYFNSFSTTPVIFSAGTGGVSAVVSSSGYLTLYRNGAGGYASSLSTNPLSTGIWYHLAWVTSDGSQWYGYVNGVQGAFAAGWSGEGTTSPGYVGTYGNGVGTQVPNAFISNLHIIKGTALYTSNFTPPTAPLTSVENTKLLCCKSNSSATAFDVSPGTITSVNAIATNFNPFTANINAVRGQESGWCTLNPLANGGTLSKGNLKFTSGASYRSSVSTIGMSSGKWYMEGLAGTFGNDFTLGVVSVTDMNSVTSSYVGGTSASYGYEAVLGAKYNNTSYTTTNFNTYTTGDLISVAFDADNGKVYFAKNGIWQDNANPAAGINASYSSLTSTPYFFGCTAGAGGVWEDINFGQKPFKFPPPAGFQPLALANTPRPSIVRPDQYVGIVTYTGTGSTLTVSGLQFKPDFVWVKSRTTANGSARLHQVFDTVRGVPKALSPNDTRAEDPSGGYDNDGAVTEITANGFTIEGQPATGWSGTNYVAWAWKAGGNSNTFNIDDVGYATAEAAGLTAGTITPTGASVNTKSGFSIVSFTAQSSGSASISHGLGKEPGFIIVKSRDQTYNWLVYHKNLTSNAYYLILNSTAGQDNASNAWNSTSPTSSVFTLGSTYAGSGNTIAYLWAEIPGFSKFGSYTGNGSADGPVIITGFRPRWVMVKASSVGGSTYDWFIYDTTRDVFNPASKFLSANYSGAEQVTADAGTLTDLYFDILSNGFKIRTNRGRVNNNTSTFIYAAFAETPSFNLYGGQANAR